MAKPALVVIAIFTLLGAFYYGFRTGQYSNVTNSSQKNSNKVIKVVDGDTFQLESGKRVRLMGVDSPEYDNCGGQEAKKFLSDLILGQNVRLTEETTEAYGRSLAVVSIGDAFINGMVMENGWGRPDYRRNTFRDELTAHYHAAQKAKRGVWGVCIDTKPPSTNCTIKGNIDPASYEKFYHLQSCRHYGQIVLNTAYGEKWFCSEEEAIVAGFKKTKSC